MFAALRKPLPVTFRVNCSQEGADKALAELRAYGGDVTYLDWCDAWQLGVGNVLDIKQRTKPGTPLHEWRQWLVERGKLNLIERQEVVSMLPVCLLQVEPEHRVLDMCAAPGSKTSQALDMMLAKRSQGKQSQAGAVVANELDGRRARILIHRLLPFSGNSDAAKVMVIRHKAQTIPSMKEEFDRIICDVPCSGDGTLRKNHGLWSHWVPHYGLSLHSTQLQIAMRGISLLRVGGRIAYSTCSLNPLENEAVVAAILARAPVKLLDCSDKFGSLKVVPGLTSWDVIDDTGMLFSSYEDALSRSRPRRCTHRFRKTHFPPSDPNFAAELRKCIRIAPHLNNTGGFFVAIFEKTGAFEKREKPALKKPKEARVLRALYSNE